MPNILTDPSFETGVSNVTATTANTTIVQTATTPHLGSACAQWTRTSGSGNMVLTTPLNVYAASAGQVWSAGAYQRLVTGTGRQIRCDIRFFNSAGTDIGGTNGPTAPTATTTYQQSKVEGSTAPAGAAWVSMRLVALSAASGNAFRTDAWQLEQGATLPAYNEGGPTTHEAAGTVAASTAAACSSAARLVAAGVVLAVTATTGAATVLRPSVGSAEASSGVSGQTSAHLVAAGSVAAVSTAPGSTTSRLTASGSTAAVSGVAGAATLLAGALSHPAVGVVAATTTATGATSVRRAAAGAVTATGTTTASASVRALVAGAIDAVTDTTGQASALYVAGGTVDATSDATGSADIALDPDEVPIVEVGAMWPARFTAAPAIPAPVTATTAAARFHAGTPLPPRYTRRP